MATTTSSDDEATRRREALVVVAVVVAVSGIVAGGLWAIGLRGRPLPIMAGLAACAVWGAAYGTGRSLRIGGIGSVLVVGWLVFRFNPGTGLVTALATLAVIGAVTVALGHSLGEGGPAFLAGPQSRWARAFATTTAVIGGFTLTTLVITTGIAGTAAVRERINRVTIEPVPEVPMAFGRYVALGDSYSAGEGVRPYEDGAQDDDDGGDDCHRSRSAYPRLLAAHLAGPTTTDFRACSGALSFHLWQTVHATKGGQNRYGIQADPEQPLPDDTGLVTVTAGGNDVRFSRILQHCFAHGDCLWRRFDPRAPQPGEGALPAPAPLAEWADAMLPVVGQRLQRLFRELRRQAPNARIIALGYPPLFPLGPAPLTISDCAIVLRRVDEDEREGLVDLGNRLNATIHAAAAASDVEYADPSSLWTFREPCGILGQLTNAAAPAFEDVLSRGAFHPTADGQRQLARLVACYLREFPEPRHPYRQIEIEGVRPLDTIGLVPAYGTFLYKISPENRSCAIA